MEQSLTHIEEVLKKDSRLASLTYRNSRLTLQAFSYVRYVFFFSRNPTPKLWTPVNLLPLLLTICQFDWPPRSLNEYVDVCRSVSISFAWWRQRSASSWRRCLIWSSAVDIIIVWWVESAGPPNCPCVYANRDPWSSDRMNTTQAVVMANQPRVDDVMPSTYRRRLGRRLYESRRTRSINVLKWYAIRDDSCLDYCNGLPCDERMQSCLVRWVVKSDINAGRVTGGVPAAPTYTYLYIVRSQYTIHNTHRLLDDL